MGPKAAQAGPWTAHCIRVLGLSHIRTYPASGLDLTDLGPVLEPKLGPESSKIVPERAQKMRRNLHPSKSVTRCGIHVQRGSWATPGEAKVVENISELLFLFPVEPARSTETCRLTCSASTAAAKLADSWRRSSPVNSARSPEIGSAPCPALETAAALPTARCCSSSSAWPAARGPAASGHQPPPQARTAALPRAAGSATLTASPPPRVPPVGRRPSCAPAAPAAPEPTR